MPNFNDEDRDSSTDDDWDKSSSDEEEKKPVQAGKFFFYGEFFLSCRRKEKFERTFLVKINHKYKRYKALV